MIFDYNAVKSEVLDEIDGFMPRDSDVFEMGSPNREDIISILRHSIQKSDRFGRGQFSNGNRFIFGVWNVDEGVGMPWFISEEIDESERYDFLHASREYIIQLQKEYKKLFNYTEKSNESAVKWVQFLGFTIDENKVKVTNDNRVMVCFQWER